MTKFSEAFLEEIRLRTSLVDLIGRDLRLIRCGHEHKAPCPFHHEKTPSFYVVEKKGFWHCHGCGAHGDIFGWMTRYHQMGFREAALTLAREAGLMPQEPGQPARQPAPPVDRPSAGRLTEDAVRRVERARGVWQRARPGAGTLVEVWLAARGILVHDMGAIGGVPASLRFEPAMPYWVRREAIGHRNVGRWEVLGAWPAMVAGIQGPDGRVSGVHITYLRQDGAGKADLPPHPDTAESLPRRKVLGAKAGGSIRFSPPGARLVLGEGVETVLSARFVRPDLPAWSAVDLGNLAGGGVREDAPTPHPERAGVFLPPREPDMERPGLVLPACVGEVVLLGESINGDAHAYACLFERACRRLARLGKRVFPVMPPHGDFNDWLMAAMGRVA